MWFQRPHAGHPNGRTRVSDINSQPSMAFLASIKIRYLELHCMPYEFQSAVQCGVQHFTLFFHFCKSLYSVTEKFSVLMFGSESETGVELKYIWHGSSWTNWLELEGCCCWSPPASTTEFDDIHWGLPESLLVIQWYSCGAFLHNFTGFSICLDVAIMFVRIEIVFVWNGIYTQPTCGSTPVRHRNVILMYLSKNWEVQLAKNKMSVLTF